MKPIDSSLSLPPASLIICTRDRPQLLLETVKSVLDGDDVPGEIVIVDHSRVPHAELSRMAAVRDCETHYIWERATGKCRGLNVGIASAAHDILAFIDDDYIVTPTWFGTLIRSLVRNGPRTAITGRVLQGTAEQLGGFAPALVEGDAPRLYQGRIGTDVLAGCHMAMYRSACEEVGEFDERLGPGTPFLAAEDNDYGFRLLEAGYRILYDPQPVIYHRAWRSGHDYFPMRWAYGRGKGGYYTKYLSLRQPYMLQRMCWDIGLRVIRFPWRLLHRPRLALGDMVYVLGIVSGAVEWTLTRQAKRPPVRTPVAALRQAGAQH
jgi:GT2 family glycosyltransferase